MRLRGTTKYANREPAVKKQKSSLISTSLELFGRSRDVMSGGEKIREPRIMLELLASAKYVLNDLNKIELLFQLNNDEYQSLQRLIANFKTLLREIEQQLSFEGIETALRELIKAFKEVDLDTVLKPQLYIV